jgi:hypothetical protein
MFPFFLIKSGEANLSSDFFSQCSLLPSPRHIFGYIVLALSYLFRTHWYDTLAFLHIIIAITLPAVIFLALNHITKYFSPPSTWPAISVTQSMMVSAAILIDSIPKFFTVAWWRPIDLLPTAHTFSMWIGMLSLYFLNQKPKYSLILLGFSLFIHPTVGLSFFIIQAFIVSLLGEWENLKKLSVVTAVSMVLLLTTFAQTKVISASQFVRIYAYQRHAGHYIPSKFSSLFYNVDWRISFTSILLVLAISWFYLKRSFSDRSSKLVLLFTLFYAFSLFLQYLAVEIFPIRFIATLGPSRFLFWGYWFCVIAISISIGAFWLKLSGKSYSTHLIVLDESKAKVKAKPSQDTIWWMTYFILVTILFLWINSIKSDTLISVPSQRYGPMLSWISQNTPENSVFIVDANYYVYSNLKVDIPIVTHRGIFVDNGFPFHEECIKEYSERASLVSRDLNGAPVDYQFKDYDYFKGVSKRFKADYVIVLTEQGKQFFKDYQPVFKGKTHWIYSLKSDS